MAFMGGIFGSGPDGDDIRGAAGLLRDPNKNAYQIQGIPQYQSQMQGYSSAGINAAAAPVGGYDQQQAAANMMQQTAMGNGPSLARANMNAGLNNTNAAIASQAMTNMGNTGAGVTQRNLLNAQAAAANNVLNQAGVASAQEQLGAQSNFGQAAQGLANTSLQQHQQQQNAYGQAAQNAQAGFQADVQQSQASQNYDAANQQAGLNKYNNEIQAVTGDANQGAAIGKFAGNLVGGAAMLMSDEACKQAIDKKKGTVGGKIGSLLSSATSKQFGEQPAAPPQMMSMRGGMMEIPNQPGAGGLSSSSLGGAIGGKAGAGLHSLMAQHASVGPQSVGQSAHGDMPMVPSVGMRPSPGYAMPRTSLTDPTVSSDERCKQMAQPASPQQLSGFMNAMEPSTFEYKDQNYSPGTHLGVMAQDVDDSSLGKDMVEQQPGGLKGINIPKALGATLASLAYLNDKVAKLEGKQNVA